jgi:hypothetical protein
VTIVHGPFRDPLLQKFHLTLVQGVLGGRRGHLLARIVRENPAHKFAGHRLAGNQRRFSRVTSLKCRFPFIKSQSPLALLGVDTVALSAVSGENRLDVSLEIN